MEGTAAHAGARTGHYFDEALASAKKWCYANFPSRLPFLECMELGVFSYVVDDSVAGTMVPDADRPGLIRVSAKNIRGISKQWPYKSRPVEIDPESMFVHEIVEEGIAVFSGLAPSGDVAHNMARKIENLCREERGLEPWPLE